MTHKNFTLLLIPKDLHKILKERADKNKIAMWRYIEQLMAFQDWGSCDLSSNLGGPINILNEAAGGLSCSGEP